MRQGDFCIYESNRGRLRAHPVGDTASKKEQQRSTIDKQRSSAQTESGTAMGKVRRIDDLGRVVIPKEIRRTMRIREGDPLLTTLTPFDKFCIAIHSVVERYYLKKI